MPDPGSKEAAVIGRLRDMDLTLRISSAAVLAADGDNILIANRHTGAYKIWPRSSASALDGYMAWRHIGEILGPSATEEQGGADAEVNAELALLLDLARIGLLDDRTDDLSGERLSGPDDGWRPFLEFLSDTRTRRATLFAVPAEYNAALAEVARFERQPSAYYERRVPELVALPDPRSGEDRQDQQFADVLLRRRTARRFSDAPVTLDQLSKLLFYGWGETASVPNPLGDVFIRKTSPSGGSLHPIEVYPVVMNVAGVAPGLYHYSVRRHALEVLELGNPREWIVEATGDQEWVAEAGVVFLLTAFLPRTAWKYHYARVGRAVISEVGFTSQTAFLAATWLGLGAFHTIALRDEIWEEKLRLDPAREPVFGVTGVGQLEDGISDHSRPRNETAQRTDNS